MDLLTLNRLPVELREAIVIRQLVPGQILFRQGDSAASLFIIETGRLKLVRHSAGNQSVTLDVIRSGESCGEIALFSEFYFYSAIAETAAKIIVYPKQSLLFSLRNHHELAEDFMTRLTKKNLALIIHLELRNIRVARQRVLQYLRYSASGDKTNFVSLDRPLKDIAIDLGLTPATLSRVLARLEHEGAIARDQNTILLQDISLN